MLFSLGFRSARYAKANFALLAAGLQTINIYWVSSKLQSNDGWLSVGMLWLLLRSARVMPVMASSMASTKIDMKH